MHHYLKALSLFSILTLIPTTAQAGAWTAKEGDTYLKGAVNYFSTSDRFGFDDANDGFEEFSNKNFNVYGEYGIKDNLTFFATGSLAEIENDANGVSVSNTGVGDIDLGLRYRLIDGPVIVSVQGLFKAPYLYSEDAELPLGNGQEDFEGKLLIGKSFGKLGYGGLEAGYRFRTDEPVDEFRFLVEYGINATEKTYLRTKLDGIIAAGSSDTGDDIFDATQSLNPQLPLEFDLVRVEYTVGYKFTDTWAGELTGTTAVAGSNTLNGTNIQAAIVATF